MVCPRNSSRPAAPASKSERPDRWSAMALTIQHEQSTDTASGPYGLAQRLSVKAASISDAVSSFLNYRPEQQLEFAQALNGADPCFKHKLATAIASSSSGHPINPQAFALLSFRTTADDLALGFVAGLGSRTPNSVFYELSKRYGDSALRGVLAEAFDDVASLCEDKGDKKQLSRIAHLLRNAHQPGGSQA